jgi:hypothetical protein
MVKVLHVNLIKENASSDALSATTRAFVLIRRAPLEGGMPQGCANAAWQVPSNRCDTVGVGGS